MEVFFGGEEYESTLDEGGEFFLATLDLYWEMALK